MDRSLICGQALIVRGILSAFLGARVCFRLRGLSLQMFTIWNVKVDGGNGKELYGDDYADIYAIQRLHFKGAMNSDCDHVSQPTIDHDRDRGKRGDCFHTALAPLLHGGRYGQRSRRHGGAPTFFWHLLRHVLARLGTGSVDLSPKHAYRALLFELHMRVRHRTSLVFTLMFADATLPTASCTWPIRRASLPERRIFTG